MRALEAIGRIRTFRHIRTLRSVRANTGAGRHQGWPRVQDLESIQVEQAKLLKARRRSHAGARHRPEQNHPTEPKDA
jgi:hypothetical protein